MSISTIPPELKIMIAEVLPPSALKDLALTAKSWEYLVRVVLYRYLDLMDENVLKEWLDVDRDKCFEHVRTLFCRAGPGIESDPGDVNRFLNSHLQHFPKLSYLSLHRGPIPSTLSQSLAKDTLKVLKLNNCSIALDKLVTLLNHFRHLEHLSLCDTLERNGAHPQEQPPQLLHYPNKLTLVGVENEVLDKFSKLFKAYKQLTFDLFLDSPMVQNFIDGSKKSLEYLELRHDVIGSDLRPFPTLSKCLDLHKVAMDNRILQSDDAEKFISWISSLNLREIIIFNVVDPWRRYKEGVEGALCELAKNSDITVKVHLIRRDIYPIGIFSHPDDAKFWFDRHPDKAMDYLVTHSYDCTIEFQNYLLELRKDCRVVLMEEREKGTVVVHDSRDSSIRCDCGLDTEEGYGGQSA